MPKNPPSPPPPRDGTRYATMTKEARLEEFKQRSIAHPHLVAADKALQEAIQESGGASIILVYGPARVGKTTMKRRVIRQLTTAMLPALQEDRERIPFLSLLLRPPLTHTWSWKDYLQAALHFLQEPLIDQKIQLEVDEEEGEKGTATQASTARARRRPPEGTNDALRAALETAIRHRRPAAVLIDEAQHFGMVASGQRLQDQLDRIKSLADLTQTVHVLIGTYDLLPFRNLSAQLIGRSIDIHFPRYHTSKKEQNQFKSILKAFQEWLPFVEEPNTLLENWDFCYERSIGCVGNLHLMLVRALHAALWSGEETLSLKRLQQHAFSVAECHDMIREARLGERTLAEDATQRQELREMLGLAPRATTAVPVPNPTSAVDGAVPLPTPSEQGTGTPAPASGEAETSAPTKRGRGRPRRVPATGEGTLPEGAAGHATPAPRGPGRPKRVTDEAGKPAKARAARPGRRNAQRIPVGRPSPSEENPLA
jgi:hypothetical protein